MHITNGFEGLDSYSINLIRFKSRRLIGHAGFTQSDRDDIEQELALHLRRQLGKHDSTKGTYKTFVNLVLDNKIRTMLSARHTSIFDFNQHAYSIDEITKTDSGGSLSRADSIDSDAYLISVGRMNRGVYESLEMQIDIQRTVATLPSDLQDLCTRLQHQSIVDIAKEYGVSRHKIDELRRRVRFVFMEHGMDQYL